MANIAWLGAMKYLGLDFLGCVTGAAKHCALGQAADGRQGGREVRKEKGEVSLAL